MNLGSRSCFLVCTGSWLYGMEFFINQQAIVLVHWPQSVQCVYLCLCVCVISNQNTSEKLHYVSDRSKLDTLLHKTHIKVLLAPKARWMACPFPPISRRKFPLPPLQPFLKNLISPLWRLGGGGGLAYDILAIYIYIYIYKIYYIHT